MIGSSVIFFFLFSYLAMQRWPLDKSQKGFSQNVLHGGERESGLEGGPARECFIISNVASPQALSKVSELREPGARNVQPPCDHLEQSSSPLSYFRPQMRASAWIMCLNTVALFI